MGVLSAAPVSVLFERGAAAVGRPLTGSSESLCGIGLDQPTVVLVVAIAEDVVGFRLAAGIYAPAAPEGGWSLAARGAYGPQAVPLRPCGVCSCGGSCDRPVVVGARSVEALRTSVKNFGVCELADALGRLVATPLDGRVEEGVKEGAVISASELDGKPSVVTGRSVGPAGPGDGV